MRNHNSDIFALHNFEGPLDFLLHLIQKREIEIYDVPIQLIMSQYIDKLKELTLPNLDKGAEFIGLAASLMWFKSKTLLPKHEEVLQTEEELDPLFEIIHELIDYCRFKEVAKNLGDIEHKRSQHFLRQAPEPPVKQTLGVEHVTLDDLARLFQKVLVRATLASETIHEEAWRVSDKIYSIRHTLKTTSKIPFSILFTPEKKRNELIVTFLAVLELMKMGKILLVKDAVEGVVLKGRN